MQTFYFNTWTPTHIFFLYWLPLNTASPLFQRNCTQTPTTRKSKNSQVFASFPDWIWSQTDGTFSACGWFAKQLDSNDIKDLMRRRGAIRPGCKLFMANVWTNPDPVWAESGFLVRWPSMSEPVAGWVQGFADWEKNVRTQHGSLSPV